MKSAFGLRLFRLFLFFSLVPAVILVAVGYYVAIHPGVQHEATGESVVVQFSDYYTALLDSTLVALLDQPNAKEVLETRGFFMLFVDGKVRSVWTKRELVHEVAAPVVKALAAGRERGTIAVRSRYYQYAAVHRGDTMLAGGLVHAPEFAQMIETYRGIRADESAADDLRTRYAVFLAIVFGAVVLVTVGLAYMFSVRIARGLAHPIVELNRATQAIAAGRFGTTVPEQGSGEIRSLIENFNSMSGQLATATARLAQAERVAAWRHIARRFAHELKNPLQPISISLFQIRKTLGGKPAYDEVCRPLDAVAEELQHLTDLADRFSKLAKLPAPQLEVVDLREVLISIGDLYREKMAGYAFSLEVPEGPVEAAVDPTYFREAIHNLLQNAMEATPSGGRISLLLKRAGGGLTIEVRDGGRGMTEEVLQSARMPYFTTRPSGSGIGLAIVEKTVSELGGRLDLQSEEGKGTVATIHLPAAEGTARG